MNSRRNFLFIRYNSRSKAQETVVLEQGLPEIQATTSAEPLPPAVPLNPSLLPVPANVTPHVFTFPENTAGQAAVRPQQTLPPQPIFPPQPRPHVYVLPVPSTSGTHSQPLSSTATKVPYSTQSYRKKKQREEQSSEVPTNRYKERTGPSVCSKCCQPRTNDHKQLYGNWYCPTMPETYEAWRQTFGDKYKKKLIKILCRPNYGVVLDTKPTKLVLSLFLVYSILHLGYFTTYQFKLRALLNL
jgi:hypothetical protein